MKQKNPPKKISPTPTAKIKYVKPEMKEVNVAVSKKVLRNAQGTEGATDHCTSHTHCIGIPCALVNPLENT